LSDPTPEVESAGDSDHAGQTTDPSRPNYKGAPLDAEAGPGLGCFWIQVGLLIVLLILTPLTVVWAFPPWVSAALLILSLVILFFVGMTMVFLLRLVAADRRAQRRVPQSSTARKTVGQLEDEAAASNGDDDAATTGIDQSEQDDARTDQG
jgi:hypothetical protein